MRSAASTILALLLIITSATAQNPARTTPTLPGTTYRALYQELMAMAPDPTKVAQVSNLVINRDAGRFTLESGDMVLCRPVNGRVCAAVFIGNGSFSMTPTTKVEREQLGRVLGKQSLDERFGSLVIFFTDSTREELERTLKFTSRPVAGAAAGELKKALGFSGDAESGYFDYELVNALLNNERNSYFLAQIGVGGADPLFFAINPFEDEEINLLRTVSTTGGRKYRELISQFHRLDEYSRDVDPDSAYYSVAIDQHRINTTIGSGLEFSASDELAFRPLRENQKWFYLNLYPELVADSARWGNGARAHIENTGAGVVWVRNDGAPAAGAEAKLTIYYRGRMLYEQSDWISLRSSITWYPTQSYKQKALFDLTFHTPARYQFVSVGEKLAGTTTDDVATSRWRTTKPIRNASFNMGVFSEHLFENDSVPPVTVLMSKTGHAEIAEYYIRQGITSGAAMEKQVGEDVASSIALFKFLFGSTPVDRFYATEIPGSHGEAFPGLIHLSWSTFQKTDRNGFDEFFRAHEVAHQWWGISVDFKSYHDQWLSEGFATYCGLMFVQAVRKDNDRFFYWLKQYRDEIVGNRSSIFGKGQEAGPIWLGYRTSSSSTGGDYDLIIYKKGAWVLHMLRNLLMDINTLGDEKFRAMMRDFYTSYAGKVATTADFQRTVEKHAGTNMTWFFQQWVYGTAIPTYTCSYNVTPAPDGKFLLKCRIDQKNVPADFKMHLPLRIDFGKAGLTRGRRLVQGPRTEFELLLPAKPEKVVFNDLESVLCEIEETDWE